MTLIILITDPSLKIKHLVYNEEFIMKKAKKLPSPPVANRIEHNLEDLLEKSKKKIMVEKLKKPNLELIKDIALIFLVLAHICVLCFLFQNTIRMWFQQIYNILDRNQLKRFLSWPI